MCGFNSVINLRSSCIIHTTLKLFCSCESGYFVWGFILKELLFSSFDREEVLSLPQRHHRVMQRKLGAKELPEWCPEKL